MKKDLIILKGIPLKRSDFSDIEKAIKELFKKEIYYKILATLHKPKSTLKNSYYTLLEALRTGRITYSGDYFEGKLNAQIVKELKEIGAKWDRRKQLFKLDFFDLPIDVKNAISQGEVAYQELVIQLDETLSQILPEEIAGKLNIEKFFDDSLWKADKNIAEQVKSITVAPELNEEQRKKIASEWQKNMQLFIKDWTEEEIVKLRHEVKEHVFKGGRQKALAEIIQKSYNVSQNKAEFLARQETSLLMSKYHEVRFIEVGFEEYQWQCVHNPKDTSPKQNTPGNVRYYHGLNDGKIFRWDSPPRVNAQGDRKNPGEDYNCRCVARPVMRKKNG